MTKSLPAEPERQLRTYHGLSADTAQAQWRSAMESASELSVAKELYLGAHWRAISRLHALYSSITYSELWVASAGCGVISAEAKIPSYDASLCAGKDSIRNLEWAPELSSREMAQRWTAELTREMAASPRDWFSQEDTWLVVLSRDYYSAIEPYLLQIAGRASNLLIFSAGTYKTRSEVAPCLREYLLPIDERFRFLPEFSHLTNTTLNAGVAEWFVREHRAGLEDSEERRTAFDELCQRLPDYRRPTPVKMTDEEVLAYITRHCGPELNSATALLRHLRGNLKMSCEQKRFGELFRQHLQTREQEDG